MDINCSGYTGLQLGAAAHFFLPRPGQRQAITRIIVRVYRVEARAAPR